jgi:hypothetical protein
MWALLKHSISVSNVWDFDEFHIYEKDHGMKCVIKKVIIDLALCIE